MGYSMVHCRWWCCRSLVLRSRLVGYLTIRSLRSQSWLVAVSILDVEIATGGIFNGSILEIAVVAGRYRSLVLRSRLVGYLTVQSLRSRLVGYWPPCHCRSGLKLLAQRRLARFIWHWTWDSMQKRGAHPMMQRPCRIVSESESR